ncbi:MAG TPA: C25 family cysteine peptidase [Chitinispirillaceae bacterium]|nr:C25 family cysteine peptidase [Chitinispirillaceae bacterium]
MILIKKNSDLNLIPVHLSRIPGWGPAADDGYYTTVNGNDQFPDLCIGRFPARNRTDLKCIVDKTCSYIRTPQRGYWKDNILLLGGGELSFSEFNNQISSEVIGPLMNIVRMDAEPSSRYYKDASMAPGLIADILNSGVFFVNFNGHGGGNIWSDNNFFGYKDLSRLLNSSGNKGGRLPVVFSFTCLTGFFESVYYRSLGEEFLRNSPNGAIAFYGASAYTSKNGNMIINKMMLENALNRSFQTIGELIRHCELNLLTSYDVQYLSLVKQYNLLGDPALPLLYPDTGLTLTVNKNMLEGNDSIIVSGQSSSIKNGNVRLLFTSGAQEWLSRFTSTQSGSFDEQFKLKAGASSTDGVVRAYLWNDSLESSAFTLFLKDSINVTNIKVTPSPPRYGDSLIVQCSVPADSTSKVACLFSQYSSSENPVFAFHPMSNIDDNTWQTISKIPVIFKGTRNEQVGIQFRIITPTENRESRLYSFKLADSPDLTFTNKALSLQWSNDSLRTNFQIINSGNAPDSLFSVYLLTGTTSFNLDTSIQYLFKNTLAPATTANLSFSVPDTFEHLIFAVALKSTQRENSISNNRVEGTTIAVKKNLISSSDTLFSAGKGIGIHPSHTFVNPVTLFLLIDTLAASQPLKNSSSWVRLRNDSIVSVSIGCRPSLTAGDSLEWLFYPALQSHNLSSDGALSIMYFDSTISRWHSASQKVSPTDTIVVHTTGCEPRRLSAAYIADMRQPDITVNVYGRSLDIVDYAAKNKPFSIFINDPSELSPSSILLFHNNKLLPQDTYSQISSNGDLEHISITAYPKKESSLDSLTVKACDLAGNCVVRSFPYLPGKDLSIQFFSCHPNPFTAALRQDGTMTTIRFAYILTDAANEIQLTIYTVTGRPVKSWKFTNLIGYQELNWDGRDRDGYRIANGTYYAKLVVKNKSKKCKKIIKIAKLEGY